MKFQFENLGYIDRGEITPGNLTIICGNNNIGKTYINYAIYGILYTVYNNGINIQIRNSLLNDILKLEKSSIDLNDYLKKTDEILKVFSDNYTKELYKIFSSEELHFKNSNVQIELLDYNYNNMNFETSILIGKNDKIIFNKPENSHYLYVYFENNSKESIPPFILSDVISKTISKLLFSKKFKRPFVITSERTGVSLFWKELDINKNMLIEKIAKSKNIDLPSLFFERLSRYAISIKHNIDIVRDIKEISKMSSFLVNEYKDDFLKLTKKLSSILNGSYKIIDDQIFFEPKKEYKRDNVQAIPLYISSSASKSLLLLYLYLNSIAEKNDVLMIDEPELNLHPSNQIEMARLLANLINLGTDVMITTHSDYIIKEFNNLIMLSNDFSEKQKILDKYKYDENDILKPEKVKAYFVDNHTIKEAPVTKFGIDMELFDKTIFNINKISDEIYYALED